MIRLRRRHGRQTSTHQAQVSIAKLVALDASSARRQVHYCYHAVYLLRVIEAHNNVP